MPIMMIRSLFVATMLAGAAAAGVQQPMRGTGAAPAQSAVSSAAGLPSATAFATVPRAPRYADDPADSLYRAAREALMRGDYRLAAQSFSRVVERYPTSAYVADAMYWEAYSRYSMGATSDLRAALGLLDTQRSRFPKAATRGDAEALAVRVRGALARGGDDAAAQAVTAQASAQAKPCARGSASGDDDRDDERIAALNALLQMNAEQALPILKQVLARRDACSLELRQKALFLVSQKRSAETENILLDVVKNDPSDQVKKRAVFWLGQVHSDRAAELLETMLRSSTTSAKMREEAVFALMQQSTERGTAAVRAVAEDDAAPASLREKAVFWLGQQPSAANAAWLRALFSRLSASTAAGHDEIAQKVLFSLSQMRSQGNDRWLMEVAADPKYSVAVRKQAIFSAGQSGVTTTDLASLYGKVKEKEVKSQLVWVLSQQHDSAAMDKLIEIAKRDPDAAMRKKAIFWLGQSNDPRVKQLLLDIINGQ
jgi:TolA-binding protein